MSKIYGIIIIICITACQSKSDNSSTEVQDANGKSAYNNAIIADLCDPVIFEKTWSSTDDKSKILNDFKIIEASNDMCKAYSTRIPVFRLLFKEYVMNDKNHLEIGDYFSNAVFFSQELKSMLGGKSLKVDVNKLSIEQKERYNHLNTFLKDKKSFKFYNHETLF